MPVNFSFALYNAYQIRAFGEILGQQHITRYTFSCTGVGSSTEDANTILDDWWDDWGDTILGVLSEDFVMNKLQFTKFGGSEGTVEKLLTGAVGTVDSSSGNMPTFCCASYRLYTSTGVSRSGWKHIGGIVKAHVVGNTYDPSASPDISGDVNLYQSFLQGDFTTAGGNTLQAATVYKYSGGYTANLITTCSEPKLGSVVSRKAGHGD